ncbi:hypothetical protein COX85_03835 [Candidatus Micrarchaeota archaeon CG_4_10_14_0_2_um_filter_55_9]|nr:MAG: hypothetical protein AUJ15_00475 [Candidatus Micrarchaeota archaeon CG1_02_55_41]PIZ91460.1 MAG: hypothetical protein COX85_03835 [Candidatus Micrarchaeota archaeon CG_4_10_14_0_2_um_filter_55_9]
MNRKNAKKLADGIIALSRAQDAGLLPNHVVIIDLRDKGIQKIFTPKRLDLLNFVLKRKGLTVTGLAQKLGRPKEAVSADLKLLLKYKLIEMPREGRIKRPTPTFKMIQLVPNLAMPA